MRPPGAPVTFTKGGTLWGELDGSNTGSVGGLVSNGGGGGGGGGSGGGGNGSFAPEVDGGERGFSATNPSRDRIASSQECSQCTDIVDCGSGRFDDCFGTRQFFCNVCWEVAGGGGEFKDFDSGLAHFAGSGGGGGGEHFLTGKENLDHHLQMFEGAERSEGSRHDHHDRHDADHHTTTSSPTALSRSASSSSQRLLPDADKIAQVTAMGFDEAAAMDALNRFSNSVSLAVEHLLGF